MAESLLLITIGPVQEFIASARRTRDLWFGSWLLSELSREAALYLSDAKVGGRLIFPHGHEQLQDRSVDVVNRIMAVLPNHEQANDVANGIDQAVRTRLTKIRDEAFAQIPGLRDIAVRERAETQVAELLELYWVVVPFEGDYQVGREALEAALAARKNTRSFGQPGYSAAEPKSSVDGQRESVVPETKYPARGDDVAQKAVKIAALFKQYGAGQAERLSGVDLLKRHGLRSDGRGDFPSTSHFAALPLLSRLEQSFSQEAARRWSEYLTTLGPLVNLYELGNQRTSLPIVGRYDASLLFEERLTELTTNDNEQKTAVHALRHFLQAFTGGKPPEPYYALLHADGDNMGRVIDHLAAKGVEQHRAFSRQLDIFARSVRATVESANHRGALIYAGGDDVLAFLPLDTALGCAADLAERFRTMMQPFTITVDGKSIAPTLSAGLAICHHIEPLSDALNLARRAEKEAKQIEGKDALAIILSKRSGVDTLIKGRWTDGFVQRLMDATTLHSSEALPDGAAYDLRDLDVRLTHGNNTPNQALLAKEAVRILKRKRGNRGQTELPQHFLDDVAAALQNGRSTRQLADELVVAREFARARGLQKEQS